MPKVGISVPEELLRVWDDVPNKTAFLKQALERWHVLHPEEGKKVTIVKQISRTQFKTLAFLVNVPKSLTSEEIDELYYPFAEDKDYFIYPFPIEKANPLYQDLLKQEESIIPVIDWGEIMPSGGKHAKQTGIHSR